MRIQRNPNVSRIVMFSVGLEGRGNWYISTDITGWKNGEWHHLAFSWDTREVRFYVDGSIVGSKLLSVPYTDAEFEGKFFRIGERSVPGNEQTAIDELRIFCRRLTDSEIIAEYQAGMNRIQQ